MSLTTLCPACSTAFRVHAEQLSARGGRVRCGKCARVFDGVAHLLQEAPEETAARTPSPQLGLFESAKRGPYEDHDSQPRAPYAPPATQDIQPAPREAVADIATGTTGVAEVTGITGITGLAGLDPETLAVPQNDRAASAEPIPSPAIDEQPAPVPSSAPQYRLLWSLIAMLSVLALAAQGGYRFRTEIAVLWPAARTYLEAACEIADCTIGLPRHADLLGIESSDLQTDPQRANFVVLNAVLRNRAQFPQEYPSLELTLTDEADRALVRKVLSADDYLDARQAGAARTQGIAAGAEATVRVAFDSSKVRATGYRLYIFYP